MKARTNGEEKKNGIDFREKENIKGIFVLQKYSNETEVKLVIINHKLGKSNFTDLNAFHTNAQHLKYL